jgi:hypothetical protein
MGLTMGTQTRMSTETAGVHSGRQTASPAIVVGGNAAELSPQRHQPLPNNSIQAKHLKNLAHMMATSSAVLQNKVLSVGKGGTAVPGQVHDDTVAQRALICIGQNANAGSMVQSQADVLSAVGRGDTLQWPPQAGNFQFNNDYQGSVRLAMNWGARGGEGTSGWTTRIYLPADFNAIATAAGAAANNFAHPSLNNVKNQTLVAIRAFRGQMMAAWRCRRKSIWTRSTTPSMVKRQPFTVLG